MALSRYEHTGAASATGLQANIGAADASFTVVSGTGFPTGAVGKFVMCIDAGTASEEKILCSARAGTSFTVATSGRGYDGTTAASHSAGASNVTHVCSAAEIDDASAHIYDTTRDDHTQYSKTDGTRAFSGAVTVTTGGLTVTAGGLTVTAGGATVTAGGLTVASGTTALQAATATTLVASSTATATAHISTLTGTNGRYVGTTNGAPISGTYLTNDFANDPTNGVIWQCTAGGTPGTWASVGGKTDAAWTNATLGNSWVNGSGSTARFKLQGGLVVGEGVISGGVSGSVAYTLPAGYRPGQAFECAVASGVGNGVYGTLVIGTDGTVSPLGTSVGTSTGVFFTFKPA